MSKRSIVGVQRLPVAWLLLSFPVGALAVLTRGYPTTGGDGDAGIFLSVAGRLLAGDKLYRGVFDNKDPLFYYSQTAALWAFGWRGPLLLDIAWVVVASVGTYLLLLEITGDRAVAVLGQLLYPFLLTGILYRDHVGYSETPGLSLLPLLAYLVYRRLPVVAGFAAAVVLLLKVSLLPVVLAIAAAGLLLSGGPGQRRARAAFAFVGSAAIGALVIFVVLFARGEARAYVETLRENVGYTSRTLQVVYHTAGLRGHLTVVREKTPRLAGYLVLFIVGAIGAALLADAAARARFRRSSLGPLTAAATIGTAIMLAETALWSNHLEALAFPIFCGGALAFELARFGFQTRPLPLRRAVAPAVAGCCVLASLLLNRPAIANLHAWSAPPTMFVTAALRNAAARMDGNHATVTYFHLGSNDEDGQGAFLGTSFQLACPRFHQYPFTAPAELQSTMQCVKRTHPQLIAVTPTFATSDQRWPRAWNQFVEAGHSYLQTSCDLVVAKPQVRAYICNKQRSDARKSDGHRRRPIR